jgi:dUTP pyrophosphatase
MLKIAKLYDEAILPIRNEEDFGRDLFIPEGKDYTVEAGETALIPLGIATSFPKEYGARIVDRSSMFRDEWSVSGLVDSGYRGEWRLMICNRKPYSRTLTGGTKAAQFIMVHCPKLEEVHVTAEEVQNDESERQGNGFGSTGA